MKRAFSLALLLFAAGLPAAGDTVVIDFESFNSLDSVTTQVSELIFSNATVLTAGVSLNEMEFPPHSGVNVVFDDGGPISLTFATPVYSVGGYFTYEEPLTLTAYDSSGNPLSPDATSMFSSNDAMFGDAGSSPNEFIGVTDAAGIFSVTMAADPNGGSFVLDDLTYKTSPTTAVPEPAGWSDVLLAAAAIALGARTWGRTYHA